MRPINRREYGLEFNVSNSQIQGLTAKDRLLIRWRHARGSHPMIPCHRPLSSGAAQAFNVCLVCGRELGFPLAADAARYELLSEPGAAPARRVLRQKYLHADVGITGANFAVAETGMVSVTENEGNARLTAAMPKTMITR